MIGRTNNGDIWQSHKHNERKNEPTCSHIECKRKDASKGLAELATLLHWQGAGSPGGEV